MVIPASAQGTTWSWEMNLVLPDANISFSLLDYLSDLSFFFDFRFLGSTHSFRAYSCLGTQGLLLMGMRMHIGCGDNMIQSCARQVLYLIYYLSNSNLFNVIPQYFNILKGIFIWLRNSQTWITRNKITWIIRWFPEPPIKIYFHFKVFLPYYLLLIIVFMHISF